MSHRKKIVLILALGLAAYALVLGAPFKTLDDQGTIINNPLIRDFANTGTILSRSYFGLNAYWRPLVVISYMVEYHLFGLNPFFFYLDNLILHLGLAVTIYALMRLFVGPGSSGPFFVALLFAIHPLQWSAVSNIFGRAILLAAFFVVLAFYWYCLFRTKDKIVYLVLSLVFFSAALLSKESAVMFPAVLVLYEAVFYRQQKRTRRRPAWAVLPFWALLAVYFLIRHALGITRLFQPRALSDHFLQVLTFAKGFWIYLRLLLVPSGLHYDRAIKVFESFTGAEVYAGLLAFVLAGVCVFVFRKRIPKAGLFFLGWSLLELVPVSQVLVGILIQRGYLSLAEHFLYVPSIGAFALLVMALQAVYERNLISRWLSPRVFQTLVAGGLVFYFLTTVQQNIYSRSETAMLKQTLQVNPHNVRARDSYAWALVKQGRFLEAEEEYRRLLVLVPDSVSARISLGKVLCDQGRYEQGLREYEKIQNPGRLEELLKSNITATRQKLLGKESRNESRPRHNSFNNNKI